MAAIIAVRRGKSITRIARRHGQVGIVTVGIVTGSILSKGRILGWQGTYIFYPGIIDEIVLPGY